MEGLTPSEQRIFTLGMLCATDGFSNIKVDYEQLANQANLKNGSTASVLFNKARRKILQLKAAGGDPAAAKAPTPKKASTGDKVTKPRDRKPAAKGKGKAVAKDTAPVDFEDEDETQGNGITPIKPDTATGTKATAAKGAKAKGKGRAATKVKAESNGKLIKPEPHVKDEDLDDFAEGIIEGTFYPEEGDILDDLWHTGAYPVQGFPGSPVTPNEELVDSA